MNQKKQTEISQLRNHYGLALEEIKLERSINNMAFMLNGFNLEDKPQYLLNEMAHQERQLRSIHKLRKAE